METILHDVMGNPTNTNEKVACSNNEYCIFDQNVMQLLTLLFIILIKQYNAPVLCDALFVCY